MEIDHSAASAFRTCPLKYFEQYVREGTGLELKPRVGEYSSLDLGGRGHELLEEYYQEMRGTPIAPYPEHVNPVCETEAQMILAAYRAKYPIEEFEIVDVERAFRIVLPDLCPRCYLGSGISKLDAHPYVVCNECGFMFLPNRHVGTGKIDLVFRTPAGLDILDHKTQTRRSNNNHPKIWAARAQASIYLWAASKIYAEPINRFWVNILTRPSPKFQEGPIFPERQVLERTPEQIAIAMRDLVYIADEIERCKQMFGNNPWPMNTEECTEGTWGDCDFYLPHTYGWSDEIRELQYQPKTPYLKLGDVDIIQP